MKYSKLQNGSDIRGVAMVNNAGEAVNLTEDAVSALARAFGIWVCEQKAAKNADQTNAGIRIAIGRDSRLTGPQVTEWAIAGLNNEGISVTDFGLASTPAMFMCTVLGDKPFDGAIMITASHLPKHRNGMKFFGPKGGLEKSDIARLIEIAETANERGPVPAHIRNTTEDFMVIYSTHLCNIIKKGVNAADYEHPLKGFKIVVDAGNGAGGFFESRVLQVLGADTAGSQFLDPDGSFPNHIPNPENPDAAKAIVEATLNNKADLGIIFDTDVDRAGAVLSDGTELTKNALIAMMSAILLKEHPGSTMVTDSITSTGLAEFIKSHGGIHRRFKRGYRNVINESVRLNNEGTDSQLAMETSGHGALKENYFLDDGAYLMVRLLIEIGKGHDLKAMIADLKEPKEAVEIRFAVTGENVGECQDAMLTALENAIDATEGWSREVPNFEGIRVICDQTHGNGWFLLRKSLHDPILPLNIESDSEGGVKTIASTLYEVIKNCEGVDVTKLAEI